MVVDLSVAPLDGEADWYTLTSHEESVQILVSTSKPSKLTTPRQKKVTDGQSADRLPSAWGVAPATTNVAAPRNGCFSFMTNSTCLFFFLLFFWCHFLCSGGLVCKWSTRSTHRWGPWTTFRRRRPRRGSPTPSRTRPSRATATTVTATVPVASPEP